MNAEKIYASATAALKGHLYSVNDSAKVAKELYMRVLNNPEDYKAWPVLYELGTLAREAKEEIAGKAGRKDVLAACKAIVKSAKGQSREALHGSWVDKEGWQTVCDGFRAIRIKNHIDALPVAEGYPGLDQVWQKVREDNTVEIRLPSMGEVKAFVAAKKAEGSDKKIVWDFGEGKPAVDCMFLLDLLRLGASETALIAAKRADVNPIYVVGDGVEAILLAVHKN